MILPDLNVILYAYDRSAERHSAARSYWERALSSPRPVGLCWVVLLGFLRLATNQRVFGKPLSMEDAGREIEGWLAQPQVVLLEPGSLHASILFELLRRPDVSGSLTTDAHLAALAIEHRCDLISADRDFARFPGLRWVDPFAVAPGAAETP